MAYLGAGNPYLYGVAEHLTGKQFHTCRDLKDVYSPGARRVPRLDPRRVHSAAYPGGCPLADQPVRLQR
jgi:hypothetical protein